MQNVIIHINDMHGNEWDFIRPMGQADIDGRCWIGNWMVQNGQVTDAPCNNINPDAIDFDTWVNQMCQEAGEPIIDHEPDCSNWV